MKNGRRPPEKENKREWEPIDKFVKKDLIQPIDRLKAKTDKEAAIQRIMEERAALNDSSEEETKESSLTKGCTQRQSKWSHHQGGEQPAITEEWLRKEVRVCQSSS